MLLATGCLTEHFYRSLEPRTMPSLAPDGLHTNSAEFCGACHIDIYQEWAGSMMGQSFTDPVFAEWHHGEEFQWCLNCHAPLQNQQPLIVDGVSTLRPPTVSGTPNPDFDPAPRRRGSHAWSVIKRSPPFAHLTTMSKPPTPWFMTPRFPARKAVRIAIK